MLIKIYQRWLIIFFVFGIIFGCQTVAAAGEIVVNFKTQPLFNSQRLAPGQASQGTIIIENLTNQDKKISLQAVSVSDTNLLAKFLTLQVKSAAGTLLYADRLDKFFLGNEIFLSTLPARASTTYTLIITLESTLANSAQGKTLSFFDLKIGFAGEPHNQVVGGGLTNQTVISSPNLVLDNTIQSYLSATDNFLSGISSTDFFVLIEWLTTNPATSRVIYAAENEAHNFDFSAPPNYGYAHSIPLDENQVTLHQVKLNNLEPNTVYYYRTISTASPPSISREHSFKTPVFSTALLTDKTNPTPQATAQRKISTTTLLPEVLGAQQQTDSTEGQTGQPQPSPNKLNWPWLAVITAAVVIFLTTKFLRK